MNTLTNKRPMDMVRSAIQRYLRRRGDAFSNSGLLRERVDGIVLRDWLKAKRSDARLHHITALVHLNMVADMRRCNHLAGAFRELNEARNWRKSSKRSPIPS